MAHSQKLNVHLLESGGGGLGVEQEPRSPVVPGQFPPGWGSAVPEGSRYEIKLQCLKLQHFQKKASDFIEVDFFF